MIPETHSTPLPSGWRWVKLGEVCDVVNGSTPNTSVPEYWDGDVVWITPTDLGRLKGNCILSSARRITELGYNSCGTGIVPPGSVVLSTRAPIGHLGIAGVPLCTNQGCKSFVPGEAVHSSFLYYTLKTAVPELQALGSGSTFAEVSKAQLQNYLIPLPPLSEQKRIASILTDRMASIERARRAAEDQLEALPFLVESYLRQSYRQSTTSHITLSSCLQEITWGVGPSWASYPVVGATRAGLAPAKEGIGKSPERYKYVDAGTIFYNPMRILLGSIAMIDEADRDGITSPDYVALKTIPGKLHYRWFYYWMRSAYGAGFIKTLARGAVRERMLFKRLAEASIDLPSWNAQIEAAQKLKHIAPLRQTIEEQLQTINQLPAALLRKAFRGEM
ncbi:MAG: restriction endonuclease subunit S [Armatimonadetes bacterium]|nr:restriction endonuclease subunit S [Armatimonadota bacterium]